MEKYLHRAKSMENYKLWYERRGINAHSPNQIVREANVSDLPLVGVVLRKHMGENCELMRAAANSGSAQKTVGGIQI